MSQKTLQAAEATFGKITALATQRAIWQVEHFDKTNDGLYKLLSGCLDLYYEIKGSSAEKTILAAMKSSLQEQGVKLQESTPVLTMLVKYVFKAERRRAYAYSRVLRFAAKEHIAADKFAEWVKNFGGIEEVVSNKGLSDEAILKRSKLDAKVEEVKQLLVSQLQTPLAVVPKTALLSAADTSEYTLLIGKMLANGQTQVLSVVPDPTSAMLDAAIKKIATALIERVDEQKKIANEIDADKALHQAVNLSQFQVAA
jgi:hypothetical protein